MASKRIQNQLQELRADSSNSFTAEPFMEGNVFHCKATIKGPTDSPYAGGVFILDIHFPPDYAFKPPKVCFETKIYHPNIQSASGTISLDILHDDWRAHLTISDILCCIYSALEEPGRYFPLMPEIRELYRCNRPLYEQTAREWTMKYAME